LWLCLGRGSSAQGVWLSNQAPPSHLRIQDSFLSLLRKYLITSWKTISLDQFDRIISIEATWWNHPQFFLYFWHGRDSFFIHHYFDEKIQLWTLVLSWEAHTKHTSSTMTSLASLFELFNPVGRKQLSDQTIPDKNITIVNAGVEIDNYWNEVVKQNPIVAKIKKRHLTKIMNIKSDLDILEKLNELEIFLQKHPAMIPAELTFGELRLKFPQESNLEQRRDLAFKKLKHWKGTHVKMKARLEQEQVGNNKALHVQRKPTTNLSTNKVIRPIWQQNKSATKPTVNADNSEQIELYKLTQYGATAAVGKNAQGNDYLRNSWAKKNDFWFHLDGQPSTHLYLKAPTTLNFDPILFNTLGSIIIAQTKLNILSATLIYCHAKDLRGVKGYSGMVTFKHEKRVLIFFDEQWKKSVERNG